MIDLNRVLVVQTWGIGDLIMATPMMDGLRSLLPTTRISALVRNAAAASALEGTGICDDILIGPAAGWVSRAGLAQLWDLRKHRFDLALVGTRITNRLGRAIRVLGGVRTIAGDSWSGSALGYDYCRRIVHGEHRVMANLEIIRQIIPEAQLGALTFGLTTEAYSEASRALTAGIGATGQVVAVHPGSGARQSDKRIPALLCRQIIEECLRRNSTLGVVVIAGPEDGPSVELIAGLGSRVMLLANQPLKVVAAALSIASVVIAGDTGVSHVAAAVGTRVVSLLGPTSAAESAPWTPERAVVVSDEALPCRPCYGTPLFGRCPIEIRCMTSISASKVVDLVFGVGQIGGTPSRSNLNTLNHHRGGSC